MRDGDGTSMLFRLAESVVNIAHIGKVSEGESQLTSQRIQVVGHISELPDQPMR
jgi:hypothetical protein